MYLTKILKKGKDQLIKIPAELSYEQDNLELEIIRIGDELRIRPAQRSIETILKKFKTLPP